ncbi:hypothetical protein [Actinomadura gamaensis]|uniref:PE-PGRS family protein n=1 Tax=Actinomadura gamaensis TaxID=1763541 RepID=A0ABV9U886_9ACTN
MAKIIRGWLRLPAKTASREHLIYTDQRAFSVLFTSAEPADWQPLVAAAPDCFGESVGRGPVPAELVEALLREKHFEALHHLAGNWEVVGADPALRRRLIATGRPEVGRTVVSGPSGSSAPSRGGWWSLRECRDALAAASRHDGWTNPAGVLTYLRTRRPRERRALVVCPVGRSARTMLVDLADELTRAEQLRALVTVHDRDGGLDRLRELNRNKLRAEVAQVLQSVLESEDAAVLRAATETAEGTEGLIEEFREFETRAYGLDIYLDMLGLRDDLDWESLRSAHADRPFGERALRALATRPDCPANLRPPAAKAETGVAEVDLRALVAEHLGADVEAWRTVRARLTRFSGDLAELLAEVGATRGGKSASSKNKAWPGAGEMPAWDRVASVSGARARFLALLDAAPTETHLILLKHLDDRTVADLFGQGSWRPEWLDFAMRARAKRYRLALAQRPALTAEAIEVLMGPGDPAVNARLFLRNGATGPQRERLLDGRVTKELVERLMERDGGFRSRDAVSCSDARLQRHIMTVVRVRGLTPQLRLLLNLWERGGPEAVADLLDNEPKGVKFTRKAIRVEARRTLTELLRRPDADAALDELRAAVAAGETAEAQLARLRAKGANPGAEVFREAHAWRWDEIVAEHRREPFAPTVLLGLSEIPECPPLLRDEAERVRWRWLPDIPDTIGGETPEEVLGGADAGPWLPGAVAAGALTWDDVIALARPASAALAAMDVPEARAALAPLVREHLGTGRDPWILALRMLPDFSGSTLELLRTVTAAITP